jgi:hypothetical protein
MYLFMEGEDKENVQEKEEMRENICTNSKVTIEEIIENPEVV